MNLVRLSTLLTAAVLAGLYLLLAESLDVLELFAALGTGLIAAFVLTRVSQSAQMHFRFRLSWFWEARRVPLEILKDCAALLTALPNLAARQHQILVRQHNILERSAIKSSAAHSVSTRDVSLGRFMTRDLPAKRAGEEPSESAGRRALEIINISLAPNTYVVDVGQDHVLTHQLLRRGAAEAE